MSHDPRPSLRPDWGADLTVQPEGDPVTPTTDAALPGEAFRRAGWPPPDLNGVPSKPIRAYDNWAKLHLSAWTRYLDSRAVAMPYPALGAALLPAGSTFTVLPQAGAHPVADTVICAGNHASNTSLWTDGSLLVACIKGGATDADGDTVVVYGADGEKAWGAAVTMPLFVSPRVLFSPEGVLLRVHDPNATEIILRWYSRSGTLRWTRTVSGGPTNFDVCLQGDRIHIATATTVRQLDPDDGTDADDHDFASGPPNITRIGEWDGTLLVLFGDGSVQAFRDLSTGLGSLTSYTMAGVDGGTDLVPFGVSMLARVADGATVISRRLTSLSSSADTDLATSYQSFSRDTADGELAWLFSVITTSITSVRAFDVRGVTRYHGRALVSGSNPTTDGAWLYTVDHDSGPDTTVIRAAPCTQMARLYYVAQEGSHEPRGSRLVVRPVGGG